MLTVCPPLGLPPVEEAAALPPNPSKSFAKASDGRGWESHQEHVGRGTRVRLRGLQG